MLQAFAARRHQKPVPLRRSKGLESSPGVPALTVAHPIFRDARVGHAARGSFTRFVIGRAKWPDIRTAGVSPFAEPQASADISEGNRAAQRAVARAHRVSIVARLDEPLSIAVRSSADHTHMVGPHYNGADARTPGICADARPIAGQIESCIGNAEDVAHIRAAPGSAMRGVMTAAVLPMRMMMMTIGMYLMMGEGWRAHKREHGGGCEQTTHTDLLILGWLADIPLVPACTEQQTTHR
jgi:hypothetical protein